MSFFVICSKCYSSNVELEGELDCIAKMHCNKCGNDQYNDEPFAESENAHKQVVDLFNEVLAELKKEYAGWNCEMGNFNVDKDGITEDERQKLHQYRERLNQIHIV